MITAPLTSNPVFTGALGVILAGGAAGLVYKFFGKLAEHFERNFMVIADVTNDDPVFDWLKIWFDSHPYSRKSRSVNVTVPDFDGEDELPEPLFTPGPGYHIMTYRGRLVWLIRWRESNGMGFMEKAFKEYFRIYVLTRKQDVLRQLFADVREQVARSRVKRPRMLIPDSFSWRSKHPVPNRRLDSVVLAEGLQDRLTRDMKWFYDSREWYVQRGIPYHRAYLFSGPPGSGKTSLVTALAHEFKADLYVMYLSSILSDSCLLGLIDGITSKRSILLLEDIDASLHSREDKTRGGVSFSCVLNALDGVLSHEGLIVMMSTNFRDRLDPALLRPGRVDLDIVVDYATDDQLRRLALNFGPIDADSFVRDMRGLHGEKTTTAIAQQALMSLTGATAEPQA